MIGTFVQTNLDSRKWRGQPQGYVIQESGCWQWIGSLDANGYGRMGGKAGLAHRWMYVREYGPLAPKQILHHKCENPGCVNPDHLETMTQSEHMKIKKRLKASCIKGHPFSPENTRYSQGVRVCVECARERNRVYEILVRLERGLPPSKGASGDRTHCPRGHEYSEENTRINPRGARECRECERIRSRKRRKGS